MWEKKKRAPISKIHQTIRKKFKWKTHLILLTKKNPTMDLLTRLWSTLTHDRHKHWPHQCYGKPVRLIEWTWSIPPTSQKSRHGPQGSLRRDFHWRSAHHGLAQLVNLGHVATVVVSREISSSTAQITFITNPRPVRFSLTCWLYYTTSLSFFLSYFRWPPLFTTSLPEKDACAKGSWAT